MSGTPVSKVRPLRIANAQEGVRHVFVRDLVIDCSIGVHDHEHQAPQRVRINLDLAVSEAVKPRADELSQVVCYEKITQGVRDLTKRGHVNLVETFAEDIAGLCLSDSRVESVRVRVEKLDVFADAESVGVEIERSNAFE